MSEQQFETRRRHDILFNEAYDDYGHYVRVWQSLRNAEIARQRAPQLQPCGSADFPLTRNTLPDVEPR